MVVEGKMIQLTGDYDTDLKAAIDEGRKFAKAYEDLNHKYIEVIQGITDGKWLVMPNGKMYQAIEFKGVTWS
jgi:hypothetical protein